MHLSQQANMVSINYRKLTMTILNCYVKAPNLGKNQFLKSVIRAIALMTGIMPLVIFGMILQEPIRATWFGNFADHVVTKDLTEVQQESMVDGVSVILLSNFITLT